MKSEGKGSYNFPRQKSELDMTFWLSPAPPLYNQGLSGYEKP